MKSVNQIKTDFEMIAESYNSNSSFTGLFSIAMEVADEQKHFVSEIIERVICQNKSCSEKQAWVVAFFIQKNQEVINERYQKFYPQA